MMHDQTSSVGRRLLTAAADGLKVPTTATEAHMKDMLCCFKKRKVRILFPFYWSHSDVDALEVQVLRYISLDDALWYLESLQRVIGNRYPSRLHWVEICNLFHVYGILRHLAKDLDDHGQQIVIDAIGRSFGHKGEAEFRCIADISAYSALLSIDNLRGAFVLSRIRTLIRQLLASRNNAQFYGDYQLHYYGGLLPCLSKLEKYATNAANQLFIPQSVISILAIKDRLEWRMNVDLVVLARNRLWDLLQPQVRSVLDSEVKGLL